MKLYTVIVYDLRMCIKEDYHRSKTFKGDIYMCVLYD